MNLCIQSVCVLLLLGATFYFNAFLNIYEPLRFDYRNKQLFFRSLLHVDFIVLFNWESYHSNCVAFCLVKIKI